MMITVRTLAFRVNFFWIELSYFIILSLLGYLALKVSKPRTISFSPKDLDVFFTAVSSTTVSSMSTVEMEVFSNVQLIFMTILMFLGGECFTSWLELHFFKSKISMKDNRVLENNKINKNDSFYIATSGSINNDPSRWRDSQIIASSRQFMQYAPKRIVAGDSLVNPNNDHVELGLVANNHNSKVEDEKSNNNVHIELLEKLQGEGLKLSCIRILARVVLSYILVVHTLGSTLIAMYIGLVPSARKILKQKGIKITTFAVFTTVSTFANCGFVPTNENMMVFKKNSGILLILIPQILFGNSLYPVCLRLTIWFLEKTTKRSEFVHLLKRLSKGFGYNNHLLPGLRCKLLAVTVIGLIFVQFIVFSLLEWHSEATAGLTTYEKFVACLFEVVNSRYSGESVFDLSVLTPAVLVLFVVMMYLPPYTTFFPSEDEKNNSKTEENGSKKRNIVEIILFSPLGNLVIFTILICITERHKMKDDPLNFKVLNIVVEVISAYGNVGFSVGYSCGRQIKPDGYCHDKLYGFAGRWSNSGKFVLIIVMFFGRLKKYHIKGGKAWKLS